MSFNVFHVGWYTKSIFVIQSMMFENTNFYPSMKSVSFFLTFFVKFQYVTVSFVIEGICIAHVKTHDCMYENKLM